MATMPPDPHIRISDDDRRDAAELMTTFYGEGRLTLAEFEERVDEVHAAKTYRELAHAFRELPAPLGVAWMKGDAAADTVSRALAKVPVIGETMKTQIAEQARSRAYRSASVQLERIQQQELAKQRRAELARRNLPQHAARMGVISVFLVGVWALTGGGYFWPAWVMLAFGLSLAMRLLRR